MSRSEKTPFEYGYELGYRQAQIAMLQHLFEKTGGGHIPIDRFNLMKTIVNLDVIGVYESSLDYKDTSELDTALVHDLP